MLILLLVVLVVGISFPALVPFASRLAHGKSFARRKRENLARIKSDELLVQLFETTKQKNEQT